MAMQKPSWQRELGNFKGIKSLFLLERNVNDLYPFWDGDAALNDAERPLFVTLQELLHAAFAEDGRAGRYQVVFFDPLRRFNNPFHDARIEGLLAEAGRVAAEQQAEAERVNSFGHPRQGSVGDQASELVRDARIIRALLTSSVESGEGRREAQAPGGRQPVAVVVDMASRLVNMPTSLDADETEFFTNLFVAANDALRVALDDGVQSSRNALVLVVGSRADLPSWFVASNPNMRDIAIPNPDRAARELYVRAMMPGAARPMLASDGEKSEAERFIDMTDGMTLRELDELRRMAARGADPSGGLCSLVDVYKYGLRENKWASLLDKLEQNPAEVIRRRVKGQDHAVDAVVSVLKRSVLGLSGATHSGGGKPKGVLFLSGPTGTGKTEIVKAVTEMLFGDERSCLRFDMSEYQGENSDQKLFGAPPGYVGYSQGGQLTNAVRANPFSVILFDEIEKACPSIMDKFLQILEDGRMTDGQGTTVYFSETIIFFTSNVGFARAVYDASGRHVVDHETLIGPGEPYETIRAKVMASMKAVFRPEFLGRIGNNVVVFDYIDDVSAAAIARQKVEGVNRVVEKQQGVHVEVDDVCLQWVVRNSLSGDVREKGGRGIANFVESAYLNVLSNFLFDARCPRGSVVRAMCDGDALRFELQDGGVM